VERLIPIYKERRVKMIFNVKGQSLELVGSNVIAEGAVEFASFTLECDSSWDAFSKTVRFRHVSQEQTYDVAGVVDGKVYYIPAEVLVRGSVFVSILGVCGTNRISTTELAGFFVEGTVESGKTPEVTENAYAQYVDMVQGVRHEVEESLELAEKCRDESETFAKVSEQVADDVNKSAEACRDYASFCQRVSGEVSGAEQSMNTALEGVRDSVETLLSRDHSLSLSENERVASENSRAENERLRRSAESERVFAEKAREDAENERIAAERGRVAGESERNAKLDEAEKQVKSIADTLFFTAGAVVGKIHSQNVSVDDAVEKPPLKFGVSGKCSQDGIPSRSTPIEIETCGKNGRVKIIHRGKNLIKFPYRYRSANTNCGITFVPLDDGGMLAYGETGESRGLVPITEIEKTISSGIYVVSGGTADCGVFVYDKSQKKYIAQSNGSAVVFEVKAETNIEVRIYVQPYTVLDEVVVYPMLRHFGTDDGFMMWDERVYYLTVPDELLSAGAVCDTLTVSEFGKESVFEKRVAKYTADGTEEVQLLESEGEYNLFSIVMRGGKSAQNHRKHDGWGFCNYLPYSSTYEGERCLARDNEIVLRLLADEFPDAPSVTAYLSKLYADGSPLEAVYTMKQPEVIEYSSDTDVELMRSVNMLSADSGEIFLEYIKDTTSIYESIIDTLVSLDARVSILEV